MDNVKEDSVKALPKIVAVDFDGTLVTDAYPEIGYDIVNTFEMCKQMRELGVKLILWTSRNNNTPERMLDKAVEYCRSKGLEFDAVNENIQEVKDYFGNDTRKVYADIYLDDKGRATTTHIENWAYLLDLRYDPYTQRLKNAF